MALLTNVFDGSLWLLAVPVSATDGSVLNFTGGLVSIKFQDNRAKKLYFAEASTANGRLTFVPAAGNAAAYFAVDLSSEDRNGFTVPMPTPVVFDIWWKADPNSTRDPQMIGRESVMVHPNVGSPGLTGQAYSAVLIPAQPYDGRVVSGPIVVGPQGPADTAYTDGKVAALQTALAGKATQADVASVAASAAADATSKSASAQAAAIATAASDAAAKASAAQAGAISAAATDASAKAAAAQAAAISATATDASTKASNAQAAAIAAAATDATSKANAAQSASAQKSANLSDLTDKAAARTNLGVVSREEAFVNSLLFG